MSPAPNPLDVLLCVLSAILIMGFMLKAVHVLQSVLDGCALLITLFFPGSCFLPMAFLGGVGVASLVTALLMVLCGWLMLVLLALKNNYGHIPSEHVVKSRKR